MKRPVLNLSSQKIFARHSLSPYTQNLLFSATSDGERNKNNHLVRMLSDPANITSLYVAKSLHAHLITRGSLPIREPLLLHNNIISKYGSTGEINKAQILFDQMLQRNAVSYNIMIRCCGRAGLVHESLELFSTMRKFDFRPTEFTFGGLLSCHSLDVFEGMQLHGLIEKTGLLYVDAFAGTSLLGMYGRHGCLYECQRIFESMPVRNAVTWNSMISAFGKLGYPRDCVLMLSEMMVMGPAMVSELTFVSVLLSLDQVDLWLGEQIHSLMIKYGFDNAPLVCNCLINAYAKCGATCLAEKMFGYARVKDIVTWNTLIGAVANGGTPSRALEIFREMCVNGLSPNGTTFVNLLSSCWRLKNLSCGKCIHGKMIERGFESDMYNGTALVTFYAKCDEVGVAHACFEAMARRNLVSWNSLMLGYSKSRSSSVGLLGEMIRSGFYPNEMSFSIVIKSSSKTELPQLHSLATKMGFNENPFVSSCLISSYAKNELVSDALAFVGSFKTGHTVCSNIIAWIYNRSGQYDKTQEVYASVENPDSMSWNILIAACSRNGDYKETLELFDHMRRSKICPDNYTYASLFSVCTKLCNLGLGRSLHGLLVKTDFNKCDVLVLNIMIDMYGKCGCLESSVMIFEEMGEEKNIITWTALVSALGLHGCVREALDRFGEMVGAGVRPDRVAFVAILSACRHVGWVDQGMQIFGEMKLKYEIEPDIDHYLTAVDLLTRNGRIKEAEKLILGMPMAPNAQIWRSFIDACKKQRSLSCE